MHGRDRSEYKALQRDTATAAKLAAKAESWYTLSNKILALRKQQQRRNEEVEEQENGEENRIQNHQKTKRTGNNANVMKDTEMEQTDTGLGAAVATVTTSNQEDPDDHGDDVATCMLLTEKLLMVNPDPMYLYNIRREIIQSSNIRPTKPFRSWSLETELRVTQTALQNNPKSYGAWFHRKWCLLFFLQQQQQQQQHKTGHVERNPDSGDDSIWQSELALTALFLQRDERNFHCWNYRRFLVSCLLAMAGSWNDHEESDITLRRDDAIDRTAPLLSWWWEASQVGHMPIIAKTTSVTSSSSTDINTILEVEWEFTTTKIQDNFSNCSAFHYRSKLLPWKLSTISKDGGADDQDSGCLVFLRSEWELVMNAVFTEPDDQTAWWYAHFLLDFTPPDVIREQIPALSELQQEMPQSKWVCLGLGMLLQAINHDLVQQEELWNKLITLDPDRTGRYKFYLRSGGS